MKFIERYGVLIFSFVVLCFVMAPVWLYQYPVFDAIKHSAYRNILLSKVTGNILLVGVFLLNLRKLTPQLLERRNAGSYILIVLAIYTVFLASDTLLYYITHLKKLTPFYSNGTLIQPFSPPSRKYPSFPPTVHFIGETIWFLLILASSSMIVLVSDRVRERELHQQILYEKIHAELTILKLQISPHFLFNTLNNIRLLARRKSDQTEDAVVELAELLRYMIYQVNDDRVNLMKEVNYLERYINLQKIRLQPHSKVDFKYTGDLSSYEIEPLLFIPFVENLFKYGIHSSTESTLSIRMQVSENKLVFQCENTLFEENRSQNTTESGMGITNIRRRLDLYYPNRHNLDIREENGLFKVYLNLVLDDGK